VSAPLAIDLFCGLGGWTAGLLAEGYYVIGFDIEKHAYDGERYPAQLVIQDVCTLHGSQFRDAALIVASPPCQAYSYMAMPWTLAKAKAAEIRADETGAKLAELNKLFNACFRIQREASEAAGRHVPMVVENVRGAIPWVGRSRWNFGSFHLWGDVPALMPQGRAVKVAGLDWKHPDDPRHRPGQAFNPGAQGAAFREGLKVPGFRFDGSGKSFQSASVRRTNVVNGVRFTPPDCGVERQRWFNDGPRSPNSLASSSSSSPRRKAASALIAKIPLPLSQHIARVYRPALERQSA
jgi:hypothetical protein